MTVETAENIVGKNHPTSTTHTAKNVIRVVRFFLELRGD